MTEQQRQAVAAMQEVAERAYATARGLVGALDLRERRVRSKNYPHLVDAAARAQVYASLIHTAMRMAMDGAERASKETE